MSRLNPYTPGAGTKPQILAGRQGQLALIKSIADHVEAGRQITPMILTGLRGMGKTSLLYESRDALRERGWLAGYYEVRRDVEPGEAVRTIIAESAQITAGKLRRSLAEGVHRINGARLKASALGFAFELDARAPTLSDPYQDLVTFLRGLGQTAKNNSVGVALLVDELQIFRKRDLAVLVQALSAVRDVPIVLIGAGLPYLAGEMSKANTYAERFRYEPLDRLLEGDARQAITEPAFSQGVRWTSAAVDIVVEEAEGYPYFLQLYASEAWLAASDSDVVTERHVRLATTPVRRQLDSGLYAARYDRLSNREREYVHAVVRVMGGTVAADSSTAVASRATSGRVASELGSELGQLGPVRDRVIKKGILHSPTYGALEFSVPGFAEYVRRRMDIEGIG